MLGGENILGLNLTVKVQENWVHIEFLKINDKIIHAVQMLNQGLWP